MATISEERLTRVLLKKEQAQIIVKKAVRYKAKGYSNASIAKSMGISESSVRMLLKKAEV